MSVQQFCLRWNNHQPNFISVCSSLLHSGTLVDVTLAAEGQQLQAHKIVLSACSSYFQTLFTTNPCQHPIVILKDVQYEDLKTMVDFMYYGEVNVSQEQLPHILKTAEMLKIKGLAEMPTDPANFTKSDGKSSNDATKLVDGSDGNNGQLGGNSGGGESSTGCIGNTSSGLGINSGGGSGADAIFQQQQQQQQQQQHQQHHQQIQHQQQQQQHHQQQQQQMQTQLQNSQTQTSQHQQQQHHQQQLRRTPSPLATGTSPAVRRKRLRKSSNNGSGERTNSEDHNTLLDPNTTSGLTLSQMSQMTFGNPATNSALGGLAAHSLHTAKLLKEASSNDLETNPHDSDSLDDTHGHVHMQIKPEVDMSGVSHSMPLNISGPTSPSEHDAPNSQSTHTEDIKITTTCGLSVTQAPQQQHQQLDHHSYQPIQMGTKRNRVLIRQPRVKRDSDSHSNNKITPETTTSSLDVVLFSTSQTINASAVHGLHHVTTHQHHDHGHSHHPLLSVPPRIERHSSEPTSPHLLSVPQTTPFLVKQHSDPLLPSQHSSHHSGASGNLTNQYAPLHRQYSHPLTGTSGTYLTTSVPLQHSHPISIPGSIYETASPPPVGSSQYIVPQTNSQHASQASSSSKNNNNTSANPSLSNTTKSLSLPHFTTTTDTMALSPIITRVPAVQLTERSILENNTSSAATTTTSSAVNVNKFRSSKSASAVMLTERSVGTGSAMEINDCGSSQSGSIEHLPTQRIRIEKLQKTVSFQINNDINTLNQPRSSHCPFMMSGPSLGCCFCWNTIDDRGKIMRRKTYYRCPECDANLCLVPCFEKFHKVLKDK